MRKLLAVVVVLFFALSLSPMVFGDACPPYTKAKRVTSICPKKPVRAAVATKMKMSKPAAVAAGPKEMPTPIVNCPPVTVQPPVVNVAPPSMPTVGVTVDNCFIYIVRDRELLLVGKDDLCVKKRVDIGPPSSSSNSD